MRVFIAGGTGTLGREIIRQLSEEGNHEIAVMSRDELKQQELKRQYPAVRCHLGDIRDSGALADALNHQQVDAIFHVAALKQIDTMEDHPLESIKTNLLGTLNIASASIQQNIPYCAFSSTDKACLPINTYGMSKALAEQHLMYCNRIQSRTRFSVFRWGNVLGSRGSVIPFFIDRLIGGKPVPITNDRMTRFWIPIEDAVKFFLGSFQDAPLDRPIVPPMKAASVVRLIPVLARLLGVKDFAFEEMGIRPGEKIHECLVSSHEYCLRSDTAEQYTDEEIATLLAPYLRSRGFAA